MNENNLKEESANIDSLPLNAEQVGDARKDTKPLAALNRQLTEDDLKSPGVRKLLLGQMDEFDACKSDLSKIRSDYHKRDKEAAVLTSKLHAYVCFDWIYSILLAVGSILIGYYASQPQCGKILLYIGGACVLASVVFKIWHNYENKVQ